ncbi:chloride channel protein [Candidatus Margulisiibacteriota bacterium]
MRRQLLEQTTLFLSVIKWTVYATVVGVLVGASTTLFLKLLGSSTNIVTQNKYYFLLMPVGFFLSSLIVMYLAPGAEGHGTEKVIEAVNKRFGKMDIRVVPVKLITTIITIVSGGSVGKEGPAAQIGGGMSSYVATILHLPPEDRRKLVICGISAGFAAVFGTPIAGAIFGIEVLYLGRIFYNVLFPSLLAGIISFETAKYLGITYVYHSMNIAPDFSRMLFFKAILAGVFFGLLALVFIECIEYFHRFFERIKIWKPFKGLISGSALVALTFVVGTKYLGLGLGGIESSLTGAKASIFDPLLKILFTAICLGGGGSGGVVTPIFFIGSTAGNFFAGLMGINPQMFAAIGMISLLAAAANTPIAAFIMAIELFGPGLGVFAAASAAVSFIVVGHRSIYSGQVLGIVKSSSLIVDKRRQSEVGKINRLYVRPRRGTLLWFILILNRRVRRFFRKYLKRD